ncbi:hypothetical protein ABT185_01075 [Streptomyces clavifer]|uniref:hypothetical protein n=1 Tax=Streptomyces clavifer TaxID=68188 RepID=UPI003334A4EB
MSRSSRFRTARALALAYVALTALAGLIAGAQGSSLAEVLVFWLSQPGLNVLYVFVLMLLTVAFGDFGDFGGGGGEPGAVGSALAGGLGAAVNVLLVRGAVCFLRRVAADLPVCRKRRTPLG